ncbi:MAG: sulfatase [Acidobacteriota bacterium]
MLNPFAESWIKNAFVLVTLSAMAACSAEPSPPPNIVLVVIDALRADHLSHYGYHRDTAGAIDDFVASSTRFADCSSQAPWTNPSVASLFTGLNTARHRTNTFGAALPTDFTTLAESLQSNGWTTAAVSFNPGVRSELDFDQGFETYDEFLGKATAYPHMEEMVSRVATWLDEQPQQPFFLYLQPMNVHGPYRVPKEARSNVLGRPPGREFRYYGDLMNGILRKGKFESRDQVPGPYLESLIDKYDTAIRYSTDQLGELFAVLSRHQLYEDTLIIVTADHGEELFDHGGFSHGWSLHRESLHVPLFIKLPGQSDGGVVEAPVELIDLYPTILEAAGILTDLDLDGRSLVPLILGKADPESDQEPERLTQTAWKGRCVARGISAQGFRLIEIERNYERVKNVIRMYDLAGDPREEEDVSGRHPKIALELRQELHRRFDELAQNAGPQPENRKDQLDQERLRALGYVE